MLGNTTDGSGTERDNDIARHGNPAHRGSDLRYVRDDVDRHGNAVADVGRQVIDRDAVDAVFSRCVNVSQDDVIRPG